MWQVNGVKLTNGGIYSNVFTNTLNIGDVTDSSGNLYSCIIMTQYDTIITKSALLTVNNSPKIISNPVDVVSYAGQKVSFSVSATGTQLSYQWQANDVNLTNGGEYSNVTSPTLIISVNNGLNGVFYRCIVSGLCLPAATSNIALLTVINNCNIPSIITQPAGSSQCEGTDFAIALITDSDSSLIYQWTKNDVVITGKTTNALEITNISLSDAATYKCLVTNSCGSVLSQAAVLTVKALASINTQPGTVSECAGSNIVFNINASGSNPLSYMWEKNGSSILNATNNSLFLNNISINDAGYYNCIVSNSCNSISTNTFSLGVNEPAAVSFITGDKTKCVNDSVKFQITATGTALSYQWYKNNLPFSDNAALLSISNIMKSDTGVYKCIVSNMCSKDSLSTRLNVNVFPEILNEISNQAACEGNNLTIVADVSGNNLQYQWEREGNNISGATNSIYSFNNLQLLNSDVYSCIISNECNSVNIKPFLLTVEQKPQINIIPITQVKEVGDSVGYYLSPSGTAPFIYQWIKNNVNIPGATNNSYIVRHLLTTDSGTYTCIVSNACGSSTVSISTLIVDIPNVFIISGNINYDNPEATPMANTKVLLNNPEGIKIDSTTADANGYYEFKNVANGSYTLNCRTTNKAGGSNPMDALLVNRYFVKLYNLSDGIRKLAADVNNDGKINPVDALLINRRFVKLISSFKIPDWLFNNKSVVVQNDDLTNNIQAICAGDVNGSYYPIIKKLDNTLMLNVGEIDLSGEGIINIPITVNEASQIGSIGLILKANNEYLTVKGLNSKIDNLVSNISYGEINIAWSAENYPLNLNSGDTIVNLIAKVNNVSEAKANVNLNSIFIESESIISDINANIISYDILRTPEIIALPEQPMSVNIYPNPLSDKAHITYYIPENNNVSIKIYDILGNYIKTIVDNYEVKGNYSKVIDGSDMTKGIYFYKMISSDKSITGKILLVK